MNILYDEMVRRLFEYRMELGLSQKEFAQILGRSQANYSRIEAGKVYMTWDSIVRLAKYSGDIDYFFTGIKTVRTELNTYFEKCPLKNRYDLLNLFFFFVNWELKKNRINVKIEDLRPLIYLRLMDEQHFDPKAIWTSIRKANGFTQIKMAETLGMAVKKYRFIERDKKGVMLDSGLLLQVYDKLGFAPSLLLLNEEALLCNVNTFWRKLPDESRAVIIECIEQINKSIGLDK